MLISVVAPNLNEEPFLKKFLNSLVNQSFSDFEVILIDGGSNDKSLNICEQFMRKLDLTVLINKKRNIGYIRNIGCKIARGELIFNTSSDVIFDPWVLYEVNNFFLRDPHLVSLTARTQPISTKFLSHMAYQSFDLLRWLFTKFPGTMRKYRPGGNFFVIRKDILNYVHGFPAVCINEDGLLGQKLDELLFSPGFRWAKVKFVLNLCVHHHVKRFEERGSIKTLFFYLYVFANLFPMLKPFLYKIEAHSSEVFKNRSDLRNFR